MSDEIEVHVSSGNIWADLGRPDAEEAFARCQLMHRVTTIIRERRLTQAEAAKILGTNQPTVSDLMRDKLSKFSLERLIGFLNALGQDVEITVRTRPADSEGPALSVVGER
ncbi:MAG TPA: helix-turn-helix transcriptional regulator [Longimicrobium sp.]